MLKFLIRNFNPFFFKFNFVFVLVKNGSLSRFACCNTELPSSMIDISSHEMLLIINERKSANETRTLCTTCFVIFSDFLCFSMTSCFAGLS